MASNPQTLYAVEQHSSRYFGLKIIVDQDRTLDDEDYAMCAPHIREIERLLQARTYKLDPIEQAHAAEERTKLLEAFPEAVYVQPVRNQYHGDSPYGQMRPWFEVTTKRGIFLVGWRKRVINLDWSKTDIMSTGSEVFPEHTATIGDTYLHSSSYTYLKECVDKLMAAT